MQLVPFDTFLYNKLIPENTFLILLQNLPKQHLLTCPPVHLPTCPPVHLLTCPPVHLLTCPPVPGDRWRPAGQVEVGVHTDHQGTVRRAGPYVQKIPVCRQIVDFRKFLGKYLSSDGFLFSARMRCRRFGRRLSECHNTCTSDF